jgi:hypothetical protein
MREQLSDWLVGVMMSTFGLTGLLLASGARDDEMTVFGFSLAGFAVCFVMGLLRRHYDERDALKHMQMVAAAAHV